MRILIFRTGSIGDTIIALPALRLLKRHYKNSSFHLLTNFPITNTGKECPLSLVLDGAGIVDEYIEYPAKKINFDVLLRLRAKIRTIKPDVLVYLMPVRTKQQLIRDWFFFKLCGIQKIIGLKLSINYQTRFSDSKSDLWEHESHRLGRLINVLGQIDFDDSASWRLSLSDQEKKEARQALHGIINKPFLAFSIGTKIDTKDWGEDRWLELTQRLSATQLGYGLVLIGSHDEFDRCDRVAQQWRGPVLNLCGKLSPRVSAAVLGEARLLVGHDSGPMHLAAAVGTPVIAIFSAQNKPGEWYPWGEKHKVMYNWTDCFGCRLQTCVEKQKMCIRGISVESVFKAVITIL
jgi:heptosyltransferase-3